MGFLNKLTQDAPPTTTDYVEDGTGTASRDVEKSTGETTTAAGPHHHHVYPEAEKRVVRKLDWRVPTLVSALCTPCFNFQTQVAWYLADIHPDLLAFLDRSNIGYAVKDYRWKVLS